MDNECGTIETLASLLCELLGLSIDKIADDITLKIYRLDSLGGLLIIFKGSCVSYLQFLFKPFDTAGNWQVILVLKLASWNSSSL